MKASILYKPNKEFEGKTQVGFEWSEEKWEEEKKKTEKEIGMGDGGTQISEKFRRDRPTVSQKMKVSE